MKFKRKNRWDVQVYFAGYMSFGVKSRTDVPQTPDSVIRELKDFVSRVQDVNRRYKRRLRKIKSDPVLRAKAIKLGILRATERQETPDGQT